MSIPFCLLLNRVHFLRDDNILTVSVSRSRAELCELLAICTFREYGNSMLRLTLTLTTSWPVYNGADPHILQRARRKGMTNWRTGLEMQLSWPYLARRKDS